MRTILRLLIIALMAAGNVAELLGAEELTKLLERSDEKELLARARLLTQEELELSRRAVRQAGRENVRAFAKRTAERSSELDKKLTDLAKDAGVPQPEPGSKPLFQRLNVIEKLQGEAFDPDYLALQLDFHREHVAIYEQLAKVAKSERVREFAREALADERTHLKAAEKFAAPLIPHAKPEEE